MGRRHGPLRDTRRRGDRAAGGLARRDPQWGVRMSVNRQIVLKRRPEGLVSRDDFEIVDGKTPEPGDNEVLVDTVYLGMDATVRTWLSKAEGYIPPVEIGEVVRCSGIGRVTKSNSEQAPVGALVATLTGWQEHAVVGVDPMLTTVLADGAD